VGGRRGGKTWAVRELKKSKYLIKFSPTTMVKKQGERKPGMQNGKIIL